MFRLCDVLIVKSKATVRTINRLRLLTLDWTILGLIGLVPIEFGVQNIYPAEPWDGVGALLNLAFMGLRPWDQYSVCGSGPGTSTLCVCVCVCNTVLFFFIADKTKKNNSRKSIR